MAGRKANLSEDIEASRNAQTKVTTLLYKNAHDSWTYPLTIWCYITLMLELFPLLFLLFCKLQLGRFAFDIQF